ncbi:U1 small nuclear ribonucleoprotein C [Bemisia tabaci]|uniref:U1 small nuclear ribonucleoprotein C n=1 Tax=Bemisia tabaci TaxID=7038 RepID=UPI0008F9C4D3|nr:PREDICTED: U1 small nuclear ribonucleoprotein C [Bemisia tabaci]
MPKYYCDYCDTYLTHDSPSVRTTHCQGRKHKDNVKFYYQKWMEEQAQNLIDATTAAFKAGKIATNPFAKGAAIPPPPSLQAGGPIRPPVPPPGVPGPIVGPPVGPMGPMMMPPGAMPPGAMPPGAMPPGAMPPMMPPMMGPMGPMRPPMMPPVMK